MKPSPRYPGRRGFSPGRLLALVGVVALLTEILSLPGVGHTPWLIYAVVFGAVGLLFGIVFDLSLVTSLVAVGGFLVLFVHGGLSGTLTLVALLALMAWLLGLILRWRR